MTTYLDNWSVTSGADDPYKAPEQQRPRLHGIVTGHPDFEDGTEITTSSVQEVDGRAVRAHNRWYYLGDVNPEYVKWCEESGIEPPTFAEPIRIIK